MDRRFLGILAAIVLIFVGIAVFSGGHKSSNGGCSAPQTTHPVEGKGQKNVTLVEYGDYQCPVCLAYYLPLKQVYGQFSSDIYFQFRNLPLVSAHPNAFAAARAAEAAGMQNKYWEMHDKLYENQNNWAPASNPLSFFSQFAQDIGLNVNQFKTDYASSKVNDSINTDLAEFKKTGQQQGTPSFFLDGNYIANQNFADPQTGRPSVDKFAQVLIAEIAKKAHN